jgi:hypothetical protein
MTYEKASTSTYAVDNLPSHSWGLNRPLEDKSSYLCRAGTNDPIRVWILGKISRLWFFSNNGEHAAQVSINVVPLCPSIAIVSHKNMATLANPQTGISLSFVCTLVCDTHCDQRRSRMACQTYVQLGGKTIGRADTAARG